MYKKESAYVIMEGDKSNELEAEFVGWRPRREDNAILVWIWRLENQECISSLKASGLQAQEELIYLFKPKGRKNVPFLEEGWPFLFYSGLELIRWSPPTLGRTICSTLFTDSNLIRNP